VKNEKKEWRGMGGDKELTEVRSKGGDKGRDYKKTKLKRKQKRKNDR